MRSGIEKKSYGDVSAVSNELEFSLLNVDAKDIISKANGKLELDPEVNKRDVIELLISMAANSKELNMLLPVLLDELMNIAKDLGGSIYGGSSVLKDTSELNPARYRTTSLSETLANNLLDIASQQIVIGIAKEGAGLRSGEEFGISLYNFLRQITPIILSISSSSPYKYGGHGLIDVGQQSRRPEQYLRATEKFDASILHSPSLKSMDHYFEVLKKISDDVNSRLKRGKLDINKNELYKKRDSGSYAPFKSLDPHQIYWMVRPRPDHENTDSVFSVEVRVSDLPIEVKKIQTINSFVLGLTYYASKNGFKELELLTRQMKLGNKNEDLYKIILLVAKLGMKARIGRKPVKYFVQKLTKLAAEGLAYRGLDSNDMVVGINDILINGTSSEYIRQLVKHEKISSPGQLELQLSKKLKEK